MVFEQEVNIYDNGAIRNRFNTLQTQFNIQQGKISALISDEELSQYGDHNTVTSRLSSLIQDVTGIHAQFSEMSTDFDHLSERYVAVESRVTTVEAGVDGLRASVSNVSERANQNTTNIAALDIRATGISSTVSGLATELHNDYPTIQYAQSLIDQSADAITLSVQEQLAPIESRLDTAEFKITPSQIMSTVQSFVPSASGDPVSMQSYIMQQADSIRLKAANISWASNGSSMTAAGALTCTSGNIGGWGISANSISKAMISDGVQRQIVLAAPASPTTGSSAIYLRHRDYTSSTIYGDWSTDFYITYGGKLYAANAEISGKITATSGKIGGWSILSSRLESDNTVSGGRRVGMQVASGSSTGAAAFYAGCDTSAGGAIADTSHTKFFVTHGGKLYSQDADISGNLKINRDIDGINFQANVGNVSTRSYNRALTRPGFQMRAYDSYRNTTGVISISPGANDSPSFGDDSESIIFSNRTLQITSRNPFYSSPDPTSMVLKNAHVEFRINNYVTLDVSQNRIEMSGTLSLPTAVEGSVSRTTTKSANVWMGSSNNDYVSRVTSSSRRYKHDIKGYESDFHPQDLYDLPVKSFVYDYEYLSMDDENFGKPVIGFIAEDVEEIYPSACEHDDEGRPEMWKSQVMIPSMLALIQEQNERIKALEDMLN